ncbi:polynucleotide 5'-hydroxyl-kinase NOL9 [Leptidea sinapis]|uniref:polynucleotide 5'-hydroxyl-kinase NOL9 n=1 Tax=Leptidea sinapis TaxID=189913 RepID=UPI0021395961|nr:polynucleotide 5'-hydroxyl-kinase NOL9 [Leptidea sinapis]
MDFFERAHIIKGKGTKGEETVKKQLKLMLKGYKNSDNKLIKEAEHMKDDSDDSTSVSGFSDLNLTASSDDEKFTHNSSTDDSKYLVVETNSETLDNVSKSTTDSFSDNVVHDSMASNKDISSDSLYTDTLSSLDKDTMDFQDHNESPPDDSSTEFDTDGKLASKIHENLKARKVNKKRKSVEMCSTNDFVVIEEELDSNNSIKHKNKKQCAEKISASACNVTDSEEQNSLSPEYVSIAVNDTPHISFEDIVGEYKHPTVRNLSIDSHGPLLSTNNSGIFSVECEIAQINTEDDVDSLAPEVADDVTISDLIEEDSAGTILEDSVSSVIEENHVIESQSSCIDTSALKSIESVPEPNLPLETNADSLSVYIGNKSCVIVMKHPSSLYLNGKVLAKSLGGNIDVCGYTLKSEDCKIIAPYYSYSQCFKTVENSNDYSGLFSKLTSAGLATAKAEDIVTTLGESDGILLLKPMASLKMEFVDNNFSVSNLFKSNRSIENVFEEASKLLDCTLYSIKPVRCFEENPQWKHVMKTALNTPKRGIVCGGKGSGKSTFLRYCVNRLLHNGPVLVIDLDPGQSEFTVAGNVSATIVREPIFGPSFTHLKTPDMMLNIGVISTMDNTKCYVNAVQQLISYCKDNEHYKTMPWIVNTMGMTNALGLKFMTMIIHLIRPHYLLQYNCNNMKKNYSTKLYARNVMQLFDQFKRDRLFQNISYSYLEYDFIFAPDVNTLLVNKFSLAPRDERYLSFLAYFGELCETFTKDIHSWVFGITPYEVMLKDLYIGVNVNLKGNCIKNVINGKVVALCKQRSHCRSKVFKLSDKPLQCYGHGLVRGIDWEKEVLYVVTPVSGSKLSLVNTLVYSDWIPDIRGQETYLPEGTQLPYRTTENHQQLMSTPRRRFNPLQLIKMTSESSVK